MMKIIMKFMGFFTFCDFPVTFWDFTGNSWDFTGDFPVKFVGFHFLRFSYDIFGISPEICGWISPILIIKHVDFSREFHRMICLGWRVMVRMDDQDKNH
jgi:hypothetical protein